VYNKLVSAELFLPQSDVIPEIIDRGYGSQRFEKINYILCGTGNLNQKPQYHKNEI